MVSAPFTCLRPCGMTSGAAASLVDRGGRPPAHADPARLTVAWLAAGPGLDPEAMDHAT